MSTARGMQTARTHHQLLQLPPLLLLLAHAQPSDQIPVLPTRYDPLAVRTEYQKMARKQKDVTSIQCANLRKGLNKGGKGGSRKADAAILDYIEINPRLVDTKVKLLCVAYTFEADHPKAKSMVSTWLHRCDGALVLSNQTDRKVPSVNIPHDGREMYENIWQKSRSNWKYVHDYYLNDYDYFVFGGTDYYVIVENLRDYLSSDAIVKANAEEPLYMGRRLALGGDLKNSYNSGGPSYILNKKALSLFVANIDNTACVPKRKSYQEDVLIGKCLRIASKGKVVPYDTRDSRHRERFHPFSPGYQFLAKKQHWLAAYSPWGLKRGLDSHSPQSIAWHYITPELMRFMEDVFYGCRKPSNAAGIISKDGRRGLHRSEADLKHMVKLRAVISARKRLALARALGLEG